MSPSAFGTYHHTCFVVHDVEKAAEQLARSAGIGPWHVWTITPERATVHGRVIPLSFRVALAEHGGASYELIAPITADNVYVEHLQTRGEGFHHTCHMFPSREALHEAKARLIDGGREIVQEGYLGDLGEFCYFAVPEIGALLEFLYLQGLPPPEKCIA
jgi:catechol 2,3-dioxygenase-like lactoylglutathione lyase family enzyme